MAAATLSGGGLASITYPSTSEELVGLSPELIRNSKKLSPDIQSQILSSSERMLSQFQNLNDRDIKLAKKEHLETALGVIIGRINEISASLHRANVEKKYFDVIHNGYEGNDISIKGISEKRAEIVKELNSVVRSRKANRESQINQKHSKNGCTDLEKLTLDLKKLYESAKIDQAVALQICPPNEQQSPWSIETIQNRYNLTKNLMTAHQNKLAELTKNASTKDNSYNEDIMAYSKQKLNAISEVLNNLKITYNLKDETTDALTFRSTTNKKDPLDQSKVLISNLAGQSELNRLYDLNHNFSFNQNALVRKLDKEILRSSRSAKRQIETLKIWESSIKAYQIDLQDLAKRFSSELDSLKGDKELGSNQGWFSWIFGSSNQSNDTASTTSQTVTKTEANLSTDEETSLNISTSTSQIESQEVVKAQGLAAWLWSFIPFTGSEPISADTLSKDVSEKEDDHTDPTVSFSQRTNATLTEEEQAQAVKTTLDELASLVDAIE